MIDHLLITHAYYTTLERFSIAEAKALAESRWVGGKDDADKSLGVQAPDILGRHPDAATDPLLCSVLDAVFRASQKEVDSVYGAELARLEFVNEQDFASAWTERVAARMQLYADGIEDIADGKLREQLSDSVAMYAAKDLVPDSISRMQSQGVMRSRKTRKNVQKLCSTLNTTPQTERPPNLAEVMGCLDKFRQKQGMRQVDEALLAGVKRSHVEEVTRKMRKQTDGPLLFLTLVTVLLAKQSRGLVYATGKFAPKLMKLLKPFVSADEYGQLERWKDLAKSGGLTGDDKKQMCELG